jgi:hypothetical protein
MATLFIARRAQRAGEEMPPTLVPARTTQPPSSPAVVVAGHADQSLTDLPQVHLLDHCL